MPRYTANKSHCCRLITPVIPLQTTTNCRRLPTATGSPSLKTRAHALGAEYRGRRVGSISHMTVFSFHPVKHLTDR